MMHRGYVVVEGHGETGAVLNLVTRLSSDLGLESAARWAEPIRGRALGTEAGVRDAVELVRGKGDAARLLILRDEDDGCPATAGPAAASWIAAHADAFPIAVVLARSEYESLFLASLETIAGRAIRDPSNVERAGLVADAKFDGDPESKRGAKEWLSAHFPRGKRYKPTLDQAPLTRMVDFGVVRRRGLAWFGTLERALRFLATETRGVYPVPPP